MLEFPLGVACGAKKFLYYAGVAVGYAKLNTIYIYIYYIYIYRYACMYVCRYILEWSRHNTVAKFSESCRMWDLHACKDHNLYHQFRRNI